MGEAQSTCATAIPVLFDKFCRDYTPTGTNSQTVICNHSGPDKFMYFTWTTGSIVKCPRIKLSTSNASPFEVALYKGGCNNGSVVTPSSMCMEDGDGIWSPDSYNPLEPNTTYYLRVRVKGNFTGTINICADHDNNLNDNCANALQIGTNYVWDDNGCNTPGPNLPPSQTCAVTLENTPWYQFTVAQTGPIIINVKNIDCDNIWMGSDGYQLGIFTGTCSGLTPIWCQSAQATGSAFVQYTTQTLQAGYTVYVTIDGSSGSNCSYELQGINVLNVLSLNGNPIVRPPAQPLYKIQGTNITVNNKARFELYDNIGRLIDRQQSNFSRNYSPGFYHMVINGKVYSIWLH
jgi:hypothetical protein